MAALSEDVCSCPLCEMSNIYHMLKKSDLTPEWMADFDHVRQYITRWSEYVSPTTSLPVLRLLVERGYVRSGEDSGEACNTWQEPLLHHFIGHSSHREHLLYLLSPEVGTNINIPNSGGSTALLEYIYYQIADTDLYDAGWFVDMDWDADQDILEIEEDWPIVLKGLEFLLERGADPLLVDKEGRSALNYVEGLRGLSSGKKAELLALLQRYA